MGGLLRATRERGNIALCHLVGQAVIEDELALAGDGDIIQFGLGAWLAEHGKELLISPGMALVFVDPDGAHWLSIERNARNVKGLVLSNRGCPSATHGDRSQIGHFYPVGAHRLRHARRFGQWGRRGRGTAAADAQQQSQERKSPECPAASACEAQSFAVGTLHLGQAPARMMRASSTIDPWP